jgi:hypothetical protein
MLDYGNHVSFVSPEYLKHGMNAVDWETEGIEDV